jgi:hypothetical protein
LTVKITKQGKNPAEIEVKKGDKSWTVKEDKLSELSDDVRRHVEGLLGRGPFRFKVVGPDFNVALPPLGRPHEGPRGPGDDGAGPPPRRRGDRDAFDGPQDRERISGRLEQRLEEMARRMEQMHEQLESLRRHLREGRDERPRRPDRPDKPERPDGPPPGDA